MRNKINKDLDFPIYSFLEVSCVKQRSASVSKINALVNTFHTVSFLFGVKNGYSK